MKTQYKDYLNSLTPARRLIAQEAIAQYLQVEADVQRIKNAECVYNVCRDMELLDEERFDILLLQPNNKLIKRVTICYGGIDAVMVDIRVVFWHCIINKAVAFIAVHNHPSGSLKPSMADDELTARLKSAGQLLSIQLRDHVIIGDGGYHSYREYGTLKAI